jgi:uncharacterized protein
VPLLVNLRRLADESLVLQGELSVAELEPSPADELVHLPETLRYEIMVQRLEDAVLATGRLHMDLMCDCSRCLKSFPQPLDLTDWVCHLPLEGEDAVPVCDDCVDLTPYVREDMVLALPQHPLCETDCPGLRAGRLDDRQELSGDHAAGVDLSLWDELNKLKI